MENQDEKNHTDENLKVPDDYDVIKSTLKDSIAQYEELIKSDSFKTKEDKDTAHRIVNSMRKQLKEHEQRKTQSMKDALALTKYTNVPPKEELREKGIREIFHFYARQHIPFGVAFNELERIMNQVDLGEFMSFCKDFSIPLSRTDIKRCFNQ